MTRGRSRGTCEHVELDTWVFIVLQYLFFDRSSGIRLHLGIDFISRINVASVSHFIPRSMNCGIGEVKWFYLRVLKLDTLMAVLLFPFCVINILGRLYEYFYFSFP